MFILIVEQKRYLDYLFMVLLNVKNSYVKIFDFVEKIKCIIVEIQDITHPS